MMGIQPCFEHSPSTVLDRLCEVDHEIFTTDPETKSILKDKGTEHSVDDCGSFAQLAISSAHDLLNRGHNLW